MRRITGPVGGILALAVYAAAVWPVLRSGFIQDDRFDVLWGQLRHEYSLGAITDAIRWTDIYVQSLGRFHPLAHLVGSISFEISNRETFKLLQFALAITIAAVFLRLLNAWTGDRRIGPIAILAMASFGQFRTDFDPILSFGIHTKVLILILLFQLVVIEKMSRCARDTNWLRIVLGALLLCAALYHEIAVVGSLGLIFISGRLDARDATFVRRLLSWIVCGYVTLRIRMYLTTSSDIAMPYYQLSMTPWTVVVAFIKQLSGLIPYLAVGEWGRSPLPGFETVVFISLLVVGSLAAVAKMDSPTRIMSLVTDGRRGALSLVFVWWIVGTAAVVSLSGGHQMWSSWGGGYINIWIAQIGLSGAIGIGVVTGLNRLSNVQTHFLCGVGAVVIALASVTARVNSLIVDSNPRWQANTEINGWEREQTIRAIDAGILNSLDQSDSLVSSPPRPWMNESYLRERTGTWQLALSNSWARFAEMPMSWPSECVPRNNVSGLDGRKFIEKIVVCPDARTKVLSSFADDFDNGYSIFAVLTQLSVSLDPEIEQNRRNAGHTLVRELRYIGAGKYRGCTRLAAISSTGEQVQLQLSGGLVRTTTAKVAQVSVRLNSVRPANC